ncbi:SDR family NAD(P)-dependent oxidoreductase [Rhodococcus sp. B50]|uniref:SDR family NAD(P)-dependent oxidoreductase n=1 Tax=Rhodococcus sp. B50 TaxID=2682847 RepID=UPI001BD64BBE|nr:SDR family NAD(P)-dependent oxidoreductase [Rhodococcus sp. B50]MBS9376083.1 putative short-chain type dehydrogenase/reductase [Rhodococcus sp. B50]
MTDLRFDGRVAVITGAGRGLGRAYALLLAARGAKVVVNDPGSTIGGDNEDTGPADEVVQLIRSNGGEAVVSLDSVATPEGGQGIIDTAVSNYGQVDILIHNAGNNRYATLSEMTYDDFDAVLDVHLRGAFHVVRPAFPLMAEAGYGRVILTGSIGGIYGNRRIANYAAGKAGVIGLSNVVALEGESRGIKSNVILPGALTRLAEDYDTSSYPPMDPALAAPTVGWLAHESCSITGEILSSIAGRVSRVFVAESPGVYQPSWSIEDVAEHIDEIRSTDDPWILPVVPSAHADHISKSFEIATKGTTHVS